MIMSNYKLDQDIHLSVLDAFEFPEPDYQLYSEEEEPSEQEEQSYVESMMEDFAMEQIARDRRRCFKLANEWMCLLWNCGVEFASPEIERVTHLRAVCYFALKEQHCIENILGYNYRLANNLIKQWFTIDSNGNVIMKRPVTEFDYYYINGF